MSLVEARETYLELIYDWMTNNNSTGNVDFTQPHVRKSLRYVYPLFMFLYTLVGFVGLIGNAAIIIVIGKRRFYHDQLFLFIGNLAFSDILKCMFVLPITLANLIIQNWIFGSFLCFFLPMMQCFPIHASMLTFLVIAIDRYRLIVVPFKSRLPAGLCTIAVWVAAVCVVLPFALYIKYIDLGAFLGNRFSGIGICYLNLDKHIEEYIRAIFVTLYAMPLAITGFLYVKVSAELKSKDSGSLSVHFTVPSETTIANHKDYTRETFLTTDGDTRIDPEGASAEVKNSKEYIEKNTQDSDDDLDLAKEKRTQSYLIAMVTLFAMCWCPLNILILVTHFVLEDGESMGHFDISYITFTWFGFLSTCINPVLFASWRMSDSTKDRLRGYLRLSNRHRPSNAGRSSENSNTQILGRTGRKRSSISQV